MCALHAFTARAGAGGGAGVWPMIFASGIYGINLSKHQFCLFRSDIYLYCAPILIISIYYSQRQHPKMYRIISRLRIVNYTEGWRILTAIGGW